MPCSNSRVLHAGTTPAPVAQGEQPNARPADPKLLLPQSLASENHSTPSPLAILPPKLSWHLLTAKICLLQLMWAFCGHRVGKLRINCARTRMKIAARPRTVLFSAVFSEDSQNTFRRITHPKHAIVGFSTN